MPTRKEIKDDDNYTWVRGHARRKPSAYKAEFHNISPGYQKPAEHHLSKLTISSWVINILAIIMSGIFTFYHTKSFDWRILSGIILFLLSTIFVARICTHWEDLADFFGLPLVIASWIVHIGAMIASVLLPSKVNLPILWMLVCVFVFIILLILLMARIQNWWENRI
jgi:hypothetical protein